MKIEEIYDELKKIEESLTNAIAFIEIEKDNLLLKEPFYRWEKIENFKNIRFGIRCVLQQLELFIDKFKLSSTKTEIKNG